ncbi:MAG: twin-arginine translocase TatA/TatE family subunit [Flavobacteriales bacterium]|nr:twin-arginine translocase TatA/TatE family subunit [Flavobacteriales bacterium]
MGGISLLFDVSGGEFMVIMLFALLFFGAKGIPDLARTLGRTMRQVRDASNEVQREIQRGANEMTSAVSEQRRAFQQSIEAAQAKPPAIPPPPGGEEEAPQKPAGPEA